MGKIKNIFIDKESAERFYDAYAEKAIKKLSILNRNGSAEAVAEEEKIEAELEAVAEATLDASDDD